MSRFTFEIRGSGSGLAIVQFLGFLEERLNGLNDLNFEPADEVVLDLSRLKSLNSVGVEEFIKWSSRVSNRKVTLVNCPRFFIEQVNLLPQFLPVHAKVESFFVPFISERTGEEVDILFEKGFAFEVTDGDFTLSPPQIKDSEGNYMVMDVIESKFFSFLSAYG